jgi:hypothetical protein
MNSFVKNFIENNIDLIESQEWEKLFYMWLEQSYDYSLYDDSLIQEFNSIIVQTQLITAEKCEEVRRRIVENEAEKTINSLIGQRGFLRMISRKDIYNSIPFSLGFSETEFCAIIDDVIKNKFSGKLDLHISNSKNKLYKVIS